MGGGGWMSCASVCDVRKHVRASMRVCACVYYRFSVLCECFWLLLLMYSQILLVRLFLHQRNGRSQARRQYKPITCEPTFPILLLLAVYHYKTIMPSVLQHTCMHEKCVICTKTLFEARNYK